MALVGAAALVLGAGCRTPREKMQESQRPRNTVLEVSELVPEAGVGDAAGASLRLVERSGAQSLHLLQVGSEAVLEERYHARHDLTLVCLRGSAIVEVEGKRYVVEPTAAVVIPRLYGYKVLPHETEGGFVALAVYSPPYEGEDVVLTGR